MLRALRQSMRAPGRGEAQRMMGRDRQLALAAVEAGPTLEEPELLSLATTLTEIKSSETEALDCR